MIIGQYCCWKHLWKIIFVKALRLEPYDVALIVYSLIQRTSNQKNMQCCVDQVKIRCYSFSIKLASSTTVSDLIRAFNNVQYRYSFVFFVLVPSCLNNLVTAIHRCVISDSSDERVSSVSNLGHCEPASIAVFLATKATSTCLLSYHRITILSQLPAYHTPIHTSTPKILFYSIWLHPSFFWQRGYRIISFLLHQSVAEYDGHNNFHCHFKVRVVKVRNTVL